MRHHHHHHPYTHHLIAIPLLSIYMLMTSLFVVTQQQDSRVVLFVTKRDEELCIHNGGINSSSCSAHPVLLFFNYLASFVPILLWCFVQTFVIFVKNFQRKYFRKRKAIGMLGEPQLFLSWYQKLSYLILILLETLYSYLLVPIAALFMLSSIHCRSAVTGHFFTQPNACGVTTGTQDQDKKYHCTATARNSNN